MPDDMPLSFHDDNGNEIMVGEPLSEPETDVTPDLVEEMELARI